MPISEIITKILHPSVARIPSVIPAENLPIVGFVADMIARMNWDPEKFQFIRSGQDICIEVNKGTPKNCGAILTGYSYAYQVKLVMDSIQASGLFD